MGILIGIFVAVLYSIVATAVYLITAGRAFEAHGLTLLSTILAYFTGGILGGAVFGYMLPWTRKRVGAIVVGMITALPAGVGLNMAMRGPPTRWDDSDIFAVVIGSIILGGLLGNSFWSPPPESDSES